MKAVTLVGTLATVLALAACGQADDGTATTQGTDATGTSTGSTMGTTGGSETTTTGTPGATGVLGGTDASSTGSATTTETTTETRSEGAGSTTGTDARGPSDSPLASPTDAAPGTPGHQDAVVVGEPRPGQADERATDAAGRGVDAATDAVSDAAITASVNAELARDDELSALGIDVDTDGGRVTLSGSAPSQEAVQRASELAQKVRGVSGVENELTVEAR